MKKLIFLLIAINLSAVVFGQSALRTKMTADQRTNYSKALFAYEHSELNILVNAGTAITIFLPNDFAMMSMAEQDSKSLAAKNQAALADFAKTYSLMGAWSTAKLLTNIKGGQGAFQSAGRGNQNLKFMENTPWILVSIDDKAESNIESTILLNNAVIHLVSGLFK
jgi:Fasciclin domain